jgi:hypothetical protein
VVTRYCRKSNEAGEAADIPHHVTHLDCRHDSMHVDSFTHKVLRRSEVRESEKYEWAIKHQAHQQCT